MGHKAPISLLLVTCILFASRIHVGADIRLEPINGSVRRGSTYTFTLRVSQADVINTGLMSFKRGDPPSVLCDLSIATSQHFSLPLPGYDCRGREDLRSYFLDISNVSKIDPGIWYCQYGTTLSNSVSLDVTYKPEIKSFGIWKVDGHGDDTVPEHANVTFRCEVDSHPQADIEIEKEGELVNQKRDGSSLIVRRAKCQDRGNYTCSAKNLLGEVKSDTMQLLVTCKPRPADGRSAVINLAATINGTVEFQVEVIAYPKPLFTLRKSKTQISVVYDINPTWDGLVAAGTITLYNIRSDQFGSYILRVHNTEGQLEYKIDLSLKTKPEQPGNLHVYNVKTRSLSLSWEKGFNGGAVQTFSVEYRQNGRQWIKHPIILSEEDDLQLDLLGLEPSSDYEIRVRASNVYGLGDYIYINTTTRCAPPLTHNKQLDVYTGVGIGIAAMMGIAGFCLILVLIFRKKVALWVLGSKAAQTTHSLEAAAADVHELMTVDHNAEDDGYETPGNKYEDLRERTVEPPNTYEQLKICQNQ